MFIICCCCNFKSSVCMQIIIWQTVSFWFSNSLRHHRRRRHLSRNTREQKIDGKSRVWVFFPSSAHSFLRDKIFWLQYSNYNIKWKMILANYVSAWMMLSISYPEADIHCAAAIESVRLEDTFTAIMNERGKLRGVNLRSNCLTHSLSVFLSENWWTDINHWHEKFNTTIPENWNKKENFPPEFLNSTHIALIDGRSNSEN